MAEENTQDTSLADKAVTAVEEGQKKASEQNEAVQEAAEKVSDLVEIDALDKVMYQGKEYTPEELNKMFLMQSDYTKKTQALAEKQKFMDNIDVDLKSVQRQPELAEDFKKIYPEKYHSLLDLVLNNPNADGTADIDEDSQKVSALESKIQELESKLGKYDEKFHDEKVEAAGAQIDALFEKLGGKYDLADEDAIVNRAQRLLEDNRENPHFQLTEAAWERLFRADHEAREKLYRERQNKLLEEQAKQGKDAADGGPGGAAPGRAKKRLTFDEATEMAIEDLSR